MKRLPALMALLPLLLTACDNRPAVERPAQTQPPSAARFQHDPKLDLFGYYLPQTPAQWRNWKLKSANLGAPSDFAAWEDGKRPTNFAPVFLEFEDVTSPTAQNELGQVYHTVSFRLLPDRYRVGAGQVTFHGRDPRIGEVVFSGGVDLAALKAAKTEGPGGGARPVLTGGLKVGAARIRNIRFTYFAGD